MNLCLQALFYDAGKNFLLRMCNGENFCNISCLSNNNVYIPVNACFGHLSEYLYLYCHIRKEGCFGDLSGYKIVLFIVVVFSDLLRRLSKSQNTVFCGRIQLFLSRLFPLSEKSGENVSCSN